MSLGNQLDRGLDDIVGIHAGLLALEHLQRRLDAEHRLLAVLDRHLQGRQWMVDAYSIADIAIFPWVRNLVERYNARELVEFDRFKDVQRVLAQFLERPAVQRGLKIPA